MSQRTPKVDMAYIASPEYRRKFDFFEDGRLGDLIYETAVAMLKHRNGTSMEDFAAVSLGHRVVVTRMISSVEHKRVKLNRENVRTIRSAKKGDLVAIHNHPTSGPPSLSDYKLLQFNSIRYGLVVGHDGSVVRYWIADYAKFRDHLASDRADLFSDAICRHLIYCKTPMGSLALGKYLERRFGVAYEFLV